MIPSEIARNDEGHGARCDQQAPGARAESRQYAAAGDQSGIDQTRLQHLILYYCFISIGPAVNQDDNFSLIDKNEHIETAARALKAIAHPLRLKILCVLGESELCVQDIANAVQLSQSAVSHQLRVLKDCKLVRFRREGKTVYYALDDDHVRSILSMGMDHIEE